MILVLLSRRNAVLYYFVKVAYDSHRARNTRINLDLLRNPTLPTTAITLLSRLCTSTCACTLPFPSYGFVRRAILKLELHPSWRCNCQVRVRTEESPLSKPCGLAKLCQTTLLSLQWNCCFWICICICMQFPTTQSSCLHMARQHGFQHSQSPLCLASLQGRQSASSDFLVLTDVRAGIIKPSAPPHASSQRVRAIPGRKITQQTCKRRTLPAGEGVRTAGEGTVAIQ